MAKSGKDEGSRTSASAGMADERFGTMAVPEMIFLFGPFRLMPRQHLLLKNDVSVSLGSRACHSLVDMFRAPMFAICCGYEDADDLDHLRSDPAFKLTCGRLPDTGLDLCSQPTLSRLENAPRLRDVIRLTYTLVDAWMDTRGLGRMRSSCHVLGVLIVPGAACSVLTNHAHAGVTLEAE